jgi:protein-export membrane protein SecD
MLHFSRWKVLAILAVVAAGVVFAAPNFLPKPWQETLRHYTGLAPMAHGLDLQGGSRFLVELDAKEMRDTWIARQVADIRVALREARIGYKALARTADGVRVEIIDAANTDKANELLKDLLKRTDSTDPIFELTRSGQTFTFTFSMKAVEARIGQAVESAIKVLQNRLNGLGINEVSIQRQGRERILIQVPGDGNSDEIRKMIGLTGVLSFQAACDEQPSTEANTPPEDCAAYPIKNLADQKIWVNMADAATVDGNDVNDASTSIDPVTNEPVVNFHFSEKGANRFGKLTSDNVGKSIAIVLDRLVISAPRIMEPILGGNVQISGQFTTAEASNLVAVLRSGALPAPISFISMTTEPGADAAAKQQGL